MVIDHIGMFYPNDTPIWFRILGRIVAPIFFYLIVEGYFYTKSKRKYFFRLLKFALIMVLGNTVISLIALIKGIYIPVSPLQPNVLISLATSLIILYSLDNLKVNKDNKFKYISLLIGASMFMLFTEAGFLGVFMTITFYYFRNKHYFIPLYVLLSTIFGFIVSGIIQSFMSFAIIPIKMYNGRSGYSNVYVKYFFYVFYIFHIWLLSSIYLYIGV